MATGKLKIDIRRQAILEQLNREGIVHVTQLSERLGATPATIRNDLDALAVDGQLDRIQGGAVRRVKPGEGWGGTPVPVGQGRRAIAEAVLRYISDGDTLFINSGTTTMAVAEVLSLRKNLNIVTNSLAVANYLAHQADMRLILLGGELNANYGFTYGGDALEQLSRYQPQWSILSVDGVHPEHGITTYHADEAMIDRTMIARAQKTIIVADHRKIGRVGFSHICGVSEGQILVTDSGCDDAQLERIRTAGAEVHVAQL
ncbi:MAG: DeoR/GlpR transcriptional regulator [Ruminococcaceae bacterium]|nr:DeoR/GlpR transcriptional regulator [Oscillospiraceae bacterium]